MRGISHLENQLRGHSNEQCSQVPTCSCWPNVEKPSPKDAVVWQSEESCNVHVRRSVGCSGCIQRDDNVTWYSQEHQYTSVSTVPAPRGWNDWSPTWISFLEPRVVGRYSSTRHPSPHSVMQLAGWRRRLAGQWPTKVVEVSDFTWFRSLDL